MRDIRPDLENRLDALNAERARLDQRLRDLDGQVAAIKAVLKLEEDKWGRQEPLLPGMNGVKPHDQRLSSPLAIFLENVLRDRPAKTLPELAQAAEQAGLELTAGNRTLHFALVGLQRNGFTRRLPDGRWEWIRSQSKLPA